MNYLQTAFNKVCADAKPAEGWYVSLMEIYSRYGGPEEGGWWAQDSRIVAYHYFSTEEQAQAAKEAVEALAQELSERSSAEHGRRCLREMDWCEDRGLEADYLPEPDGPSEFYVLKSQGIPTESVGPTSYE